MKRFFLKRDIRFDPIKIEYNKYKGYLRKGQKRKGLYLTVLDTSKKGEVVYKKRYQLVRIRKGEVVIS